MQPTLVATAHAVFPKPLTPTIYFVGVTTGHSSIMRVFPAWANHFGFSASIVGIDCDLDADPTVYRRIVSFIAAEDQAVGAIVTAHKVGLLDACQDMFTDLDSHAALLREVSAITKRGDQLVGHAFDAATSGRALNAAIGECYWRDTDAEVLCLGAGGAGTAVVAHLLQRDAEDRPLHIRVSDRDPARLEAASRIHHRVSHEAPVTFHLVRDASESDHLVNGLRTASLVINATGLGKDAQGSPLTATAHFPEHGVVWDLNYRGDLLFLTQAREQQASRDLRIEDGWAYFVHGWVHGISLVLGVDLPHEGPEFEQLSAVAERSR
ncbi:MAG: shikimate dehydrogenase [Gemmatimonadetes bacterium]|jgi:shikimate 5-dehydrogenase|nr:shikimate dehydrogenase [Gemmatimonadota bacterium]